MLGEKLDIRVSNKIDGKQTFYLNVILTTV